MQKMLFSRERQDPSPSNGEGWGRGGWERQEEAALTPKGEARNTEAEERSGLMVKFLLNLIVQQT